MDIVRLSAKELILINDLKNLAEEALNAEKLINESFVNAFGIGNTKLHVYHEESFGEYFGDGYLTINRVFSYHDNWWGGRSYEFSADFEGIYRMLRSCYLRRHDLADMDPEEFDCNIEHLDTHFREFIKDLNDKKMLGKEGPVTC